MVSLSLSSLMVVPKSLMTESAISNHHEKRCERVAAEDLGYNIAVKKNSKKF